MTVPTTTTPPATAATGTVADPRTRPGAPAHPVITLWDFTWFTRTGPGEPFEDLDAACAAAVARGYDTIRICAAPFLLFRSGLDASAVALEPLGTGFDDRFWQRVRWYDVREPTVVDVRAQLLDLFRACERHGLWVIASSWEYQQTPSFAAEPDWYRALHAVDPEERAVVLADAHADLVDLLDAEGLGHRLLLTELHNEVQIGHLCAGLPTARGHDSVPALTPRLEAGIARFRQRHPDRPVTVNYAGVPVAHASQLPRDLDALVVHPYVYGVLDDLIATYGLRGPSEDFDDDRARELLRAGAPGLAAWRLPPDKAWKLEATIVCEPEMYVHDWCDPQVFDRWLYDGWGEHRRAMEATLTLWLEVAADVARGRAIPLLLGEGYVGYTPRDGRFEEGPVGAELCRHAVREAARVGVWGAVVCSNAAPHHAMWDDVDLQRECAALLTGPGTGAD